MQKTLFYSSLMIDTLWYIILQTYVRGDQSNIYMHFLC